MPAPGATMGGSGGITLQAAATGVFTPYATLALARAAAVTGDNITVGPGTYEVTTNLALSGGTLSYYLQPGVVISFTAATGVIFDDEGAATTLNIGGYGSISIGSADGVKAFNVTHASSTFHVVLNSVSLVNAGGNANFVVYHTNGRWLGNIDYVSITGSAGTPNGLYWRKGPHVTTMKKMTSALPCYMVWAEPTGTLLSDINGEMFVNCNEIYGGGDGVPPILAADGGGGGGANTFAAIWINANRITNPVQGQMVTSNFGAAIYCDGPKLYVLGKPKITGGIQCNGGILYVDAMKQDIPATSVAQVHATDSMLYLSGGASHIFIGEVADGNLEAAGTTMVVKTASNSGP